VVALAVLLALVAGYAWYKRVPYRTANAAEYNPLTLEEQRIILHEGTERAFSGKYHNFHEEGIYTCKQCDQPLFKSESKFDSGTGWPSFDDAIPGAIREVPDGSRTEIECSYCGGHIGHVFRGEGFTDKSTRHCANSLALNFVAKADQEKAIFAGGCFWGVEHHMERMPGVLSVTSGYIGGRLDHPSYEDVSYKHTGHAEAVEVLYDRSRVSYEDVAKMFFEIHDPTQTNRQGPDIGEQYRSAVFYLSEEQKQTAEKLIGILKDKGLDVVTQVQPAGTFWKAEDYHQNYYHNNGKTPYCHTYTKRF
jgi:peptide methionine sulfoxide reductase msrA/msrB